MRVTSGSNRLYFDGAASRNTVSVRPVYASLSFANSRFPSRAVVCWRVIWALSRDVLWDRRS